MPRDSAAVDGPASYLVGTAAAFPLFFQDRTKPITPSRSTSCRSAHPQNSPDQGRVAKIGLISVDCGLCAQAMSARALMNGHGSGLPAGPLMTPPVVNRIAAGAPVRELFLVEPLGMRGYHS